MKRKSLKELKVLLTNKLNGKPRIKFLKKEYQEKENPSVLDKLKIIGITGSRGKSTTAYIVHQYLKFQGYKSILYSSLGIDSPASIIKPNEACEVPIYNEENLLSMLDEAEAYDADYLVLEVNETAIEKGLVDNIPFDVRVLTTFHPQHNVEQYSKEKYKQLKKSFFENLDEQCTCVLGMGNMISKEDYEEFLNANNCRKVTFGSKHIVETRGLKVKDFDFLLHELDNSLNGLKMEVLVHNQNHLLTTKTILAHNALNYVSAMATLAALGVLDVEVFKKCIKEMMIPGREEVVKANGRTIVVGLFLNPALENFKMYKDNKEVTKIKVLTGSIGSGFKTWKEVFKSETFILGRAKARQYAMNEIKPYADYVYLTSNDNAKENAEDICQELQGYLGDVPSKIIVDRELAITKAIKESEVGDLIFISGRGNRRILCDSETTVKLIKDLEVVEKVLTELGW